jgi:cytochrome c-type biogenesis protein CcmH/NrfG
MAERSRTRWTGVAGAAAVTVLLAIYLVVVASRATSLIGSGEGVGVVLGIALWVLPVVVVWLVAREWFLALDVQRMADELAAADELPVDDLPRSPGGRIDRAAARAAFEPARERVETDPDDWRSWYHLAFAYDAAGDRRRARGALRAASRLHRGKAETGPDEI